MIIIYNNREEYEKSKSDRIQHLYADVIAVANENEYDIVKSRYTGQAAGVRFSYLEKVIQRTVIYTNQMNKILEVNEENW